MRNVLVMYFLGQPPSDKCREAYERFKGRVRPTSIYAWSQVYESNKSEMRLSDEQMVGWLDEMLTESWEAWHRSNQRKYSQGGQDLD